MCHILACISLTYSTSMRQGVVFNLTCSYLSGGVLIELIGQEFWTKEH